MSKLKSFKQGKIIKQGYLQVSELHKIYYIVSGNPKGKPVVYLHGGPGDKSKPKHRKIFNPKKWMIVQFDQRGCGLSQPQGETRENTIQDLAEDTEKLRLHLEIDKWVVAGGSWGATVALVYAENYSSRVEALLLISLFLAREEEDEWLFVNGARKFFPDLWEQVAGDYNSENLEEFADKQYSDIFSNDIDRQKHATLFIENWENNMMKVHQIPEIRNLEEITENDINSAKIFYHYMRFKYFVDKQPILKNTDRIKDIPTTIIQGRYDMISCVDGAYDLHRALPGSQLFIMPSSGHSSSGATTRRKILEVTESL